MAAKSWEINALDSRDRAPGPTVRECIMRIKSTRKTRLTVFRSANKPFGEASVRFYFIPELRRSENDHCGTPSLPEGQTRNMGRNVLYTNSLGRSKQNRDIANGYQQQRRLRRRRIIPFFASTEAVQQRMPKGQIRFRGLRPDTLEGTNLGSRNKTVERPPPEFACAW